MSAPLPVQLIHDLGGRRARLLVVDDQPINVRVIRRIFADQHDVFMACNGEDALNACAKVIPDLVLLDVEMPGMDGLEVCRRMKDSNQTHDIPVIFVTARQAPEEETICWEVGCVDFICKPYNAVTLYNRVSAHLKLKFQSDQLREIAFTDGLTGVAIRRHLDERLVLEWRRGLRNEQALSALMVDVDFFKRYNDAYGHQQGDQCLRMVAQALKAGLNRPADLVARYGGEEFVCILPETERAGAAEVAARLEAAVRALSLPHGASDAATVVTISIGCASVLPATLEGENALIQEADAQLYCAKRAGRGRFSIAGE
jgi:diguanylate cyclase (GGDEF)-like protein